MAASIYPPVQTIQKDQLRLSQLLLSVLSSFNKLKKSQYQLDRIERSHTNQAVQQAALVHYNKNCKLMKIASDLIVRLKSRLDDQENSNSAIIQQLAEEVDIFNFLHFEVAKAYFAFIPNHYRTQVIRLTSMAA